MGQYLKSELVRFNSEYLQRVEQEIPTHNPWGYAGYGSATELCHDGLA